MSFVDLHLHLLPGVDDGAPTLASSLAHARRMVAEGVGHATVTPHVHPAWSWDRATLPDRLAELRAALRAEGIPLRVEAGGELDARLAAELSSAELETFAHGPEGRRWLLVETPWGGVDAELETILAGLRARGFGALLAHPERSAGFLPHGLERLRSELTAGTLLQVNVCSLLGRHGPGIQRAAGYLVRNRLAFVLASDGHPGTREHTLRLGFDLALTAGASSLGAWRLTQANPRFLLEQGILPAQDPIPALPAAVPASPGAVARAREARRTLTSRR